MADDKFWSNQFNHNYKPDLTPMPESEEKKPGFWDKQFTVQATESQMIFDVIFGVALPIFCFLMDPAVFTSAGEK